MNATRFLRDVGHEDDGLFCATIWVDETPPRYISISLDEAERPGELYFEAEDQVYGKYTKSLTCTFSGSTLILATTLVIGNFFHWTTDRKIQIEMKSIDLADARQILQKIFSVL
jgi:hypothetical protein